MHVNLEADIDCAVSSLGPFFIAQIPRATRVVGFVERNGNEDGKRIDGLRDKSQDHGCGKANWRYEKELTVI